MSLYAICGDKHIPVTSTTVGAKECLDVNIAGSASTPATPSTFLYDKSAPTLNIKVSAGTLQGGTIYNGSGSVIYLQFHNTASTPAGGAVPFFVLPLGVGGSAIFDSSFWTDGEEPFTNGLAIAISTTAATYTAPLVGVYGSVEAMVKYS